MQMPPKQQSYIYASNELTDEFLFGDDILIDQPKTKKAKKNKGGPKSFISDTVSSISDGRAITESSSQMTKSSKNKNCVIKTLESKKPPRPQVVSQESAEIDMIKTKINDACSFPKTLNY